MHKSRARTNINMDTSSNRTNSSITRQPRRWAVDLLSRSGIPFTCGHLRKCFPFVAVKVDLTGIIFEIISVELCSATRHKSPGIYAELRQIMITGSKLDFMRNFWDKFAGEGKKKEMDAFVSSPSRNQSPQTGNHPQLPSNNGLWKSPLD